MRKNNSDGTFSHDPYPLITERKKFNQTETHARQLIQDESGSELNAMQAILKETQEKEAARILNEKRAKEEKIAALKKTIQAEETKSRAEIQKQLNTAAHTLNGALSTSYQSALTNQEARIKK